MDDLPVRYVDGQRGFDRRIMEELAAVGVPCYTLGDLANGPRTIPQGIPIFVDWLADLEKRIPGPESEHRAIIRSGLIRNLIDPAARGNQQAIDLLIAQMRRQPPLPTRTQDWACLALRTIATGKNFDQIAGLLAELPVGSPTIPLVEYLGKVKTARSRDIAVKYLGGPTREAAIKALVQMKAPDVRHLIEPFLDDPHPPVRKQALRAMEKLPHRNPHRPDRSDGEHALDREAKIRPGSGVPTDAARRRAGRRREGHRFRGAADARALVDAEACRRRPIVLTRHGLGNGYGTRTIRPRRPPLVRRWWAVA